jgi:replication factor C subunit 1
MDDYFLGTEDRESIIELGVDKNNGEEVSKKIPSATKAAFTRTYNASNQ